MRAVLVPVLLAALLAAAPATAQERPNVVVVMTDDQSMDGMFALPKTVQAIGDRGVSFDQSFVSLSLCCPSRATFLTGEYAHNHHVLDNMPPLGGFQAFDDDHTLPVWLQDAGYATSHIGKYLNEYGVEDPHYVPPGWTDWHGTIDPSTYSYDRNTFNDNGVLTTTGRGQYNTTEITDRAVAAVDRFAADGRPFFLNVWYMAPHSAPPYDADDPEGYVTAHPEPRYQDAFEDVPVPRSPSFDEADLSDKSAPMRSFPRLDADAEAAVEEVWQQRMESLLSVDDGVERIMAALERTGELANTYVLFTSDNGYYRGQHRIRQGKNYLYEPGIQVPLLLRGPGIPAGERRGQLVANVDLAPTIAAMAGVMPSPFVDGASLLPFARDATLPSLRPAIMLESLANPNTGESYYRGVRTRRFKLIRWAASGFRELYDLQTDPDELDSRLKDPAYRGVLAEMTRRFDRLGGCVAAACRESGGIPEWLSVSNLEQPGAHSTVPQPPLVTSARGSCAAMYTPAVANGGPVACPPGTWPAPGAGWAPVVEVAGGDRLRLEFDQPVDSAKAAIVSNRTAGPANAQIMAGTALTATGDPKVWELPLPAIGARAIDGVALAIVARSGDVPRAFGLGLRTPRYADYGRRCGLRWFDTNDSDVQPCGAVAGDLASGGVDLGLRVARRVTRRRHRREVVVRVRATHAARVVVRSVKPAARKRRFIKPARWNRFVLRTPKRAKRAKRFRGRRVRLVVRARPLAGGATVSLKRRARIRRR